MWALGFKSGVRAYSELALPWAWLFAESIASKTWAPIYFKDYIQVFITAYWSHAMVNEREIFFLQLRSRWYSEQIALY